MSVHRRFQRKADRRHRRKADRGQAEAEQLTPEQLRQVELTKRGLCSRCGQLAGEHSGQPHMLCPDRAGCYSFAFDRESRRAAIARMERVRDRLDEGAQQRKALSPDATALLDVLADAAGVTATPELIVRAAAELDNDESKTIGKAASGPELAARLGWTYDRVRLAAVELETLGYLQTQQGGPLS